MEENNAPTPPQPNPPIGHSETAGGESRQGRLDSESPPPVIASGAKQSKFPIKLIAIIVILFLLSVSSVAGFVIYRNLTGSSSELTECTLEAMICPDGSSVGRTGPNCSFSPCPNSTPDPTTNWNTYEGDGFSFKYPSTLTEGTSERSVGSLSFDGPTVRFDQVEFLSDLSSFVEISTTPSDVPYRYNGVQVYIYSEEHGPKLLSENYWRSTVVETLQQAHSVKFSPSVESLQVNNVRWTHVANLNQLPINYYITELPNKKILILNKMENQPESFGNDFDQILSTFKFTE